MSKSKILYIAIGLVFGFLLGFGFANAVNHKERDDLRAELQRQRFSTPNSNDAFRSTSPAAKTTDDTNNRQLSEDEISNAIKTADARAGDLYLQKNLGFALYAYAKRTPDFPHTLLTDIARLLKRACDGNAKDRESLIALGNVLFDIAQKNSEPASFREARVYYEKALALKPNDADTRADLGLTYFLGNPSDPQQAIIEYRRSLAVDSRHEPALQNLVAALIKTGQREEAARRLNELQQVDAGNPALPELRAELQQGRAAPEESH